jgi:hypothetical protein
VTGGSGIVVIHTVNLFTHSKKRTGKLNQRIFIFRS